MQPDDDSQTTLSKWPFIIGDVLLVATALAIAILGDWQLTNWQVGACVASVALGAAFFVLPYVVEFQVRVREESEDRAADLRILEKHILSAEQTLDAIDARILALEAAAPEPEQPNAALLELADKKIAQLEAARTAQEAAIQALQKSFDALPKEAPAAFDPEVLKPLEKRLKALESRPLPEVPAEAPVQETVNAPSPVNEEKEAPSKETPEHKEEVPQIERPKRSSRDRHRPEESRLLKRAISEKGDKSSAAVSRIIESKVKAKEKAAEAPKEAEGPEPEPEKEEPAAQEKEAPEVEEPKSVEKEALKKEEAKVEELLFDEEKITSPVMRTKAKKNDAVLTASVFIGIGNKPYLRGSAGGLSWDKGVAMEFQEIGKWRWVAPSDLEAALELQIYRNDEDPDSSGKFTLEPGQKLEVTPVF